MHTLSTGVLHKHWKSSGESPGEIFVATVTQAQLLQTFFRQGDMKLRLAWNLLCVDGLEPLIFQPALYGPAIIDRCQPLFVFCGAGGGTQGFVHTGKALGQQT